VIGQLLYPQTENEQTAGVTPVQQQYPPYNAFRYLTAAQQADVQAHTMKADITTALQNCLNAAAGHVISARDGSSAASSKVFIPAGFYRVNGTLSMQAGQIIQGVGWATVPNSFAVAGGSMLAQFSTADIPLIQCAGADDSSNQKERPALRDIALYNSNGRNTAQTGFYARYARQLELDNVYVSGFNIGINLDTLSWLVRIQGVRVMNFHTTGLRFGEQSEDSLIVNSQFSGYDPHAIAVHLTGECANNTFMNCYTEACNFGYLLDQYDDGNGNVYPMNATFIGCLAEDILSAVFASISSLNDPNYGNIAHPAMTIIHPRCYIGIGWSGNSAVITTPTSTGASGNGATATITFAIQVVTPKVGSKVSVYGMLPPGYNGTHTVTASSPGSVSFASAQTGSQTRAGTLAYNGKTYNGSAGNGQAIVYAMYCSQISLDDPTEAGFSYGAVINGPAYTSSPYGYFYKPGGANPGPIKWGLDNNYLYENSRFYGDIRSVIMEAGDHAMCRLTAIALTTGSSSTTTVPFNIVVEDAYGWSQGGGKIVPTKSQAMRFRAQVYIDSFAAGSAALQLFKNGSDLSTVDQFATSSSGNAEMLKGEFYDTPNGSTDTYSWRIHTSVGQTIDTGAGNTWCITEVAGK
jgi:hypothetical protein